MDFVFEQNEQGNREPIQIIGEELECSSYSFQIPWESGMSIEDEGCMGTEITERVGPGWIHWKKCGRVSCDIRMPAKLKGRSAKQ